MWRGHLHNLSHVYALAVPCDVTLVVDHHNDCSDFLKKQLAVSVSMYYRKSVVFILSQVASKQLASSVETG